jgi:hypothetical protein
LILASLRVEDEYIADLLKLTVGFSKLPAHGVTGMRTKK